MVLLVELKHSLVVLDSAIELAEIVFADRGGSKQQDNRELRIVRDADHLLVDASERIGPADGRADALELFLRLRVPWVLPERARVAFEGAVQITE